jgi:hypothetical protein
MLVADAGFGKGNVMSPHEFFRRWAPRIDADSRDEFLMELAMLMTVEQARERRRLCTDARVYRHACEETAAELRRLDVTEALEATA